MLPPTRLPQPRHLQLCRCCRRRQQRRRARSLARRRWRPNAWPWHATRPYNTNAWCGPAVSTDGAVRCEGSIDPSPSRLSLVRSLALAPRSSARQLVEFSQPWYTLTPSAAGSGPRAPSASATRLAARAQLLLEAQGQLFESSTHHGLRCPLLLPTTLTRARWHGVGGRRQTQSAPPRHRSRSG